MQIVGFLILANVLPVAGFLLLGVWSWLNDGWEEALEMAWVAFAAAWGFQVLLAVVIGLLVLGLKLSGQI